MTRKLVYLLIFTLLCLQANFALSQVEPKTPVKNITPANVLEHVKRVQAELRLIQRKENAVPTFRRTLVVSNVAPREVYFQALTLFNKANHLCFEYTQQVKATPKLVKAQIKPADVWQVVDDALQQILAVKRSLEITQSVTIATQPSTTTPTDVFNAIIQTNQQINSLLTQSFRPSTVYQQIEKAISYTAVLLDQFPGANVLPDKPPLQANKKPVDVYRLLIKVFNKIKVIAKLSNVKTLTLNQATMQIKDVEPSDVYDMATLVVSELAYFKNQVSPEERLPRTYFPGYKTSSQVYQRIGILLKQLDLLKQHVKQYPDWLKQDS